VSHRFVPVEQFGGSTILVEKSALPHQVVSVLNARIEPLTAYGTMYVRRIPRQKNAPLPMTFRQPSDRA
jgi:hypothetical protein